MNKVTQQTCREAAARHYLVHLNGIIEDWIKTGDNPQDEVDSDIVDLSELLWAVAQQTSKNGIG